MPVERLPKCEKWLPKGEPDVKESSWWLSKLIEKIEMPETISRFPFYHNHSFIMTLRAGLEGYHMNVDGKHIASFPYTTVSFNGFLTISFHSATLCMCNLNSRE
jgi:hypothetical protein